MDFTSDQLVKIILALIALLTLIVTSIFAVNRRSHKLRDIKGSNNKIINGDFNNKDK